MKRRICLFAVGAMMMFALSAMAQDQKPAEGRGPGGGRGQMMTPDEQVSRLSTELNLTDDQKAKIKPLFEDQAAKMKALREDTSTSMDDKRPKMQDIRKSTNDQVRAVLTADQQKKYDEMQAKMRERQREGQKPADAPKPPQ
jgi:periplasmic protein CpxP/Spy